MRLLRLLRSYLWFFDYVAIAVPAALVPWVFAIAFAALSVIFALRKQTSLSGRIQVGPFEDDQVVTLSEEYFSQFFVGDTVNLAAFSKAVNVLHEFLAGYVFEYGLDQPVSEIQAAAALESDQLVTQAVAAREEEVSHVQKLEPMMQEKAAEQHKSLGSQLFTRFQSVGLVVEIVTSADVHRNSKSQIGASLT